MMAPFRELDFNGDDVGICILFEEQTLHAGHCSCFAAESATYRLNNVVPEAWLRSVISHIQDCLVNRI